MSQPFVAGLEPLRTSHAHEILESYSDSPQHGEIPQSTKDLVAAYTFVCIFQWAKTWICKKGDFFTTCTMVNSY